MLRQSCLPLLEHSGKWGGGHGSQARHLHFSPNHCKWIGRNELKMTTRPGHDCYLTLFHFATCFSSPPPPPNGFTRRYYRQERQINPHYSLLRARQDSPQMLTCGCVFRFKMSPIHKSHGLFKQDYQKIGVVTLFVMHLNQITHPEGETAGSSETWGQTPYTTRCNNPEDHHLTLTKLYEASTECLVVELRTPDLLASAFTSSQPTKRLWMGEGVWGGQHAFVT
jgi:hypothetical protein